MTRAWLGLAASTAFFFALLRLGRHLNRSAR